jgi:hypothetical protein
MIVELGCKGKNFHNLATLSFEAFPPSKVYLESSNKRTNCILEEPTLSKQNH